MFETKTNIYQRRKKQEAASPKPASTPREFAHICHSIAPAATAFCASLDLKTRFPSRTMSVLFFHFFIFQDLTWKIRHVTGIVASTQFQQIIMEAPLGGDSSDISRDSAGQRLYAQLGNVRLPLYASTTMPPTGLLFCFCFVIFYDTPFSA